MVEPQIRYDDGAVFLARALARAASVTKASTDSSEDVADVGLGLSICRSIIEAHGGKLWALPRGPFGTTFYLTLPSAEAADRTDLDTNDSC
jgi:K+-sensing histidine kinase KdpD